MNPTQLAIQGAGGPAKVAAAVGCTVQAVCFWRDGKRTLPAEVCPTLERLTQGAVRCEDLRPDVDWSVLRTPVPEANQAPALASKSQPAMKNEAVEQSHE